MNSFERRNKIVDLVNAQGSVLVIDLSNTFGISEVTIRADLRLLEEKGLVTRFHGGAAKPGTHMMESDNQEVTLEDRYKLASDPKKRIAQAATGMIAEGMTVILDSGSTTMLIAEALAKNPTSPSSPIAFLLRLPSLTTKTSRWWSAAPCAIKRIQCTAPSLSALCRASALT
jgi:DeoR/GlpR family transcriptional regulator of sugar metabolism